MLKTNNIESLEPGQPRQKTIAVDLRSLHTSEFSGVESYVVHVLEQLLANDRNNIYRLFYNGYSPKKFNYFHFNLVKYSVEFVLWIKK